MPVVELLKPASHEKILDLGCGDGALTRMLQKLAKTVIGVDNSASMVQAAQQNGVIAYAMAGHEIAFPEKFDAVFSNAALHWMHPPQQVIQAVFKALVEGGRFVAEMGAKGNINSIVTTIESIFAENPTLGSFHNPWFFPSRAEYTAMLEEAGFQVDFMQQFERPTQLTCGIREWLEMFTQGLLMTLTAEQKDWFIHEMETRLKPVLFDEKQGWVVDYMRLRFKVSKPKSQH